MIRLPVASVSSISRASFLLPRSCTTGWRSIVLLRYSTSSSSSSSSGGGGSDGGVQEEEEAGAKAAAASASSAGPLPSMTPVRKKLTGRQMALRVGGGLAVLATAMAAYELSKPRPGEVTNPDESAWHAYYRRLTERLHEIHTKYAEPIEEKLLPDPLPEPYQRPYTLVIDLDKTLVHSTWTLGSGWRSFSRPGVEYFLAYLSNFYEIVIFSDKYHSYAEPIIDRLDKHRCVIYRLYRDSTKYENGVLVKDLRYLNRDLRTVVVLDDEIEPLKHNPDNLLQVKTFEGDPSDRYLLHLIPFLETLAVSGVQDVRPIISQYRGLDVPAAFEENQRKLSEMRRQEMARYQQQRGKGVASWLKKQQAPPPQVDIVEMQAQNHKQFMEFMAEQKNADLSAQAQPPPIPEMKMTILGWLRGEQPKISSPADQDTTVAAGGTGTGTGSGTGAASSLK